MVDQMKPEIVKEYMTILRPCIHLHGIQIKSDEAFRRLCIAIQEIEEVAGIKETTISFEDIFVCPDINIDSDEFETYTPMEALIKRLIRLLRTS